MNLQMFREKMLYEINRLEEFTPFGMFAIDRVQVHLYCISALLEKILEVIPDYGNKNLKEFVLYKKEGGEDRDITIKKLIGRIRHYIEFTYGIKNYDPSVIDTIDVISDHDLTYENLDLRNISLEEFLNISKEIGKNDRKILKPLLSNTIKILKKDIQFDDKTEERNRFFGRKTVKSIEYLFDLIRKIGDYKLPNGFITFFKVDHSGSIDVEGENIDYSFIFKYLQSNWIIIPDKTYVKAYPNISNLKLKDKKTIPVWNFHDEFMLDKHSKYIIIADDLVNMLDQIM